MTSVKRSGVFPTRKRALIATADHRHDGLVMVRRVPKGDAPKPRLRVSTTAALATVVLVIVVPTSALRSLAIEIVTTAGHAWATAALATIRRTWAIIGLGAVLHTLPITHPAANKAQCLRIIPACGMAEVPSTASHITRSVVGRRHGTSRLIVVDRTTRGCTLATLRLTRTVITHTGISNITVTMRRGATTGIAGIRRIVGRISVTIGDTTGTMLTTARMNITTRTVGLITARTMHRTPHTDAAMTGTARRIATAASADVRAIGTITGDRIAGRHRDTTAIVDRRTIAIEIRLS
jgi:hypothetical protein